MTPLRNMGGADIADILPGLSLPRGMYTMPTFTANSPIGSLVQKLLGGGQAAVPQPVSGTISPQQAVPGGIASQPQPTAAATPAVSPLQDAMPQVPAPVPNVASTGAALNDFAQMAAAAGIPPPSAAPSVAPTPPGPPAVVGGMPPGPGVNTTQFDLMMQPKPKIAGESAKPPTGTNTPAKPAAAPATAKTEPSKGQKVQRAASALSAVTAPPNPQGVNPSTPAAVQPRAVDLGAMDDIVRQVLMRSQATQLPQLSAFLQRRPMA